MRKPRRQHTGALCVQHSPTTAALSTSFLLNHVPQQSRSERIDTRFRSHTEAWIWLRNIEEISGDWLNFSNALIEHLSEKWVFSVCQVCRYLRWHSKASFDCSLYISAKKYQNAFMCVKVITSQRWDIFWETVYFEAVVTIFFFPRLFSAVAGWMSTILPHMMWLEWKFRMYVWNVLHAACWKYRMQKLHK